MCRFVSNFVRYYLNWFTVGKVVAKIKGVNVLLRHSVGGENDYMIFEQRTFFWQAEK